MFNKCPGSLGGTPTLKIKKCPECGNEVEIFSNDVKVDCEKCGFTIYNNIESCVQWCKYARYCVGEQLYKKFKRKRIAFAGVTNTVRSVMAEALAREINTSHKLGFISAGVSPSAVIDPLTLEALGSENIYWRGKPKDIAKIGQVDIFVLMGPEVELPPGLESCSTIRWDIPLPGTKDLMEYRRLINILKDRITLLIGEAGQDD